MLNALQAKAKCPLGTKTLITAEPDNRYNWLACHFRQPATDYLEMKMIPRGVD